MSEISKNELEDMSTRYQELVASQQTLLLSTASTAVFLHQLRSFCAGQCGCVLYLRQCDGVPYVNLLNNPRGSLLFIRPESEARNLFARERAVLNCSVRK